MVRVFVFLYNMNFHIITIFPEVLQSYFDSSILGRAQKKKLINIKYYNPRDFVKDKHKTVDDRPFGGGAGMVMMAEPIVKAVKKAIRKKKNAKIKIVLFAPAGKLFTQKNAIEWSKKYIDVVLICGRYEGIDERIVKIIKDELGVKVEKVSVGDFVLTGGEVPAEVVVDAVSRQIPGVLGKQSSLEEESGLGVPAYTRPAEIKTKNKTYKVPKVLLSGDHKKIEEWRLKHSLNMI